MHVNDDYILAVLYYSALFQENCLMKMLNLLVKLIVRDKAKSNFLEIKIKLNLFLWRILRRTQIRGILKLCYFFLLSVRDFAPLRFTAAKAHSSRRYPSERTVNSDIP